MTSHFFTSFIFILFLNLSHSFALKVLIGNDDSWATANIRAIYNVFKAAGHDCIIAAPAMQQSGTDGIRRQPTILQTNGAFDAVLKGSPPEGHDAKDDHIWYINSTPASSIEYGLSTLCPKYFHSPPDIVLTGTNQGSNLALAYLGSGTFGAAKFAITSAKIPAIALSSGNFNERDYTTLGGPEDQANIYATMTLNLVEQLIKSNQKPLLPNNTLLNVNFPNQPKYDCQVSTSKWIQSRILPSLDKNPDSCFCNQQQGSCKLPTETQIILKGQSTGSCLNSISVSNPTSFNPDASKKQQSQVHQQLKDFLSCQNM